MAYRMALVLVTLSDFESHSPVAGLFKCNPSNRQTDRHTYNTHTTLHHCSILPHCNRQRARAVPQRQVGFLQQMLFPSVSKMVERKENEKWFSVSVTILTPTQNCLATIWPSVDILQSLVLRAVSKRTPK